MSQYNIKHTDVNVSPKVVEESTVNDTDLDIALFGRIRLEYGERLNQNLLNILENFSCPQLAGSNPPQPDIARASDNLLEKPTVGQFWHNSSDFRIYVWIGDRWMALMNADDYAGNWGQIEHGQYLPRPVSSSGYVFDYSECIWSTSPAAWGKFDAFTCYADSSGLVTAQYRQGGSTYDSIANYVIVGIKGNNNVGVVVPPPSPSIPPSATPTPTPTQGASPTPTPTNSPTPTPSPTQGVSATPAATVTPTPTVTRSPTPTPTPTPSKVPPLVVSVTDPEGGTNASSLVSYCNIASYNSTTRDSGYATCGATTITTCADGSCAPEPGDSALGPVMRVTVSGGIPPYTVSLRNFALTSSTGTQECIFVGGAVINSLPAPGNVKSYTINTSGGSTPIISLNGKCGPNVFSMLGTFDILVTDSAGSPQSTTISKTFNIYRTNISNGGGGGGPGGGGVWDQLEEK